MLIHYESSVVQLIGKKSSQAPYPIRRKVGEPDAL